MSSLDAEPLALPGPTGRATAQQLPASPEEHGPAACAHCGDTVPAGVAPAEDGARYCCTGCEAVATYIRAAGLERFYRDREGYSPRPEERATSVFDSPEFQRANVTEREDGLREAQLRIGGLRCSACVWLNERALSELDGVADAHVSYGTGRATVRWDPARLALSEIAHRIATLGYRPLAVTHELGADRDLVVRLAVAAFCAGNVMLLRGAVYIGAWSGDMAARYQDLFDWASLLLATPAALYSAAPFYDRALAGIRHRVLSMDLPVSIAIFVMYAHGLVGLLTGADNYLDSLTMLVVLLLAGRVVESRGRSRAAEAAESVLGRTPESALLRRDGDLIEVTGAEIRVGDLLVCRTGDAVAADGRVASGAGRIDVSHVTGETAPRSVGPGDEVVSGAVVYDGSFDVKVSATGEATTSARIAKLVGEALSGRAPATRFADRIAPWFTAAVLLAGSATFVGWALAAGIHAALPVTIAVLVVACPCALALATPAAVAAGIGASARHGAFVRDGSVLEALAEIDTTMLDKTGTVTRGSFDVESAEDELLALAASVESGSRHPLARSIVREATRRQLAVLPCEDFEEIAGVGVSGTVGGRRVSVTSGVRGVRVGVDGQALGEITLRDRARDDAGDAIRRLPGAISMLSGDTPDEVERVARTVGVERAAGNTSPEQKRIRVASARERGARVMFVGDGINDAPALAEADVAVVMGSGPAASFGIADVVVLEEAVAPVVAATIAGRVTRATLRRNAAFAVAYNACAVGLAAAGLIGPLAAATLMPLSSAVVIANALRIHRTVRREMEWTSSSS